MSNLWTKTDEEGDGGLRSRTKERVEWTAPQWLVLTLA